MSQFSQGHACIIGVGADLPNTVNDAVGLATLLMDPERCAYPSAQVQTLTSAQATRSDVLRSLDTLAATTTSEATVIVYFSGHGYKVSHPMMGDRYFLMPYGYDLKALASTAIASDEFATKLRAIPAKKLLLLLDCCHAGGLGDLSNQGFTTEKAPLPPEAQALFEKGQGRIVVASSRADEKSLAGRPYSAFTLALIEALAGQGASVKDGYVRVADLAMYAREVVPLRTRGRQHPILNFEGADNFHLAYYAGGDPAPKDLPYEGEPEIEAEPGELNRQMQRVEASGDRSIASAGNITNSTVIPGDRNIVGSGNVVQTGQNNFSAHTIQGVQIGNTYNSPSPPDADDDSKAES